MEKVTSFELTDPTRRNMVDIQLKLGDYVELKNGWLGTVKYCGEWGFIVSVEGNRYLYDTRGYMTGRLTYGVETIGSLELRVVKVFPCSDAEHFLLVNHGNLLLELLTQPILPDDKIPMVELMVISLNRIFGSVELKNVGVLSEEDQYGVIAYYTDSRFGFTLTAKPDHFEFWLSVNGDRMMINQLELFDQMRTWGFKL